MNNEELRKLLEERLADLKKFVEEEQERILKSIKSTSSITITTDFNGNRIYQ